MGIFDGLKRTMNIGGSKIRVLTEDDVYSQFDVVKGEVVITTPEYEQAGDSIKLELREFWTETRSTGKSTTTVTVHKTHATVPLHGPFAFAPGGEHRFAFEVELARNCRISTSATGWCLGVTMDIPNAIDPTAREVLKVQPAEEFLAIVGACEEHLRFQERLNSRRWDSRAEATYFRLLPPDVLKSELDYLALQLHQAEDGSVSGDLIFNLQEKSIADYFKAILGKDKIRRPFHLGLLQIYTADRCVQSETIAEAVGGMLREVVEQRQV